jgi:radical SAM superfamily enzyme with C-terminal helix-hairpin-helix motif
MTDTNITLELSPKLQQEQIVTSYIRDLKTNRLVVELNHKYDKKTIISKIVKDDWTKTIERFEHEMKRKGVSQERIATIADVTENQYQDIFPPRIGDNLDGGLIC